MAPWWWFPCKPKHVGAVLLILKWFNNFTFFNVVCIKWKLKCWILLMHGVCMKFVFLYFGYPDWGFSVIFPLFYGKCQGIYNSQRRGMACNLPKIFVLFNVLLVLCRSVYCLCVNVYCTTATGWQPNCSLTNISYHIKSNTIKYPLWVRFCLYRIWPLLFEYQRRTLILG